MAYARPNPLDAPVIPVSRVLLDDAVYVQVIRTTFPARLPSPSPRSLVAFTVRPLARRASSVELASVSISSAASVAILTFYELEGRWRREIGWTQAEVGRRRHSDRACGASLGNATSGIRLKDISRAVEIERSMCFDLLGRKSSSKRTPELVSTRVVGCDCLEVSTLVSWDAEST